MRFFDGHGNEVTKQVVGLQVENKQLRIDVELLENEVARLKKKLTRKKRRTKEDAIPK